MEYELEEGDYCGNVPECGAIFMANTETQKVCFKRKVFGLPSFLANFVKQVKEGMFLFLFEYEKRQLFGVYKATTNGAINLMPHAFSSIGKQFPAQVSFSPIWICSPLSESEFKGAISENYYQAKKFKFGLSADQVGRLLQLFSTRRLKNVLPSRQLIKDFHQSSKKFRERVGGDMSSANEMLGMDQGLEDFSSSPMHPFIDDAVDNDGAEGGIFRQDFTAIYADGSLIKNRRVNSERSETDLYRSCDRLLGSRSVSLDVYLDNERIPSNSVSFFRDENGDSNHNIFSNPNSAVASNFTRVPVESRKIGEWPYFDGKNKTLIEDGRSLMDGMIKSEPDFDPLLLERRYGVNMIDDSYDEEYLLRERGNNRKEKLLMSEKVLGLNPKDDYIRLRSLSKKFGTPLNEEHRLSSVDNLIQTSYIDCLNRSNTFNLPSVIDTCVESRVVDDYRFNRRTSAINELDFGNVTRAGISPNYNTSCQPNRSSSECLNMSYLDVQFSDCNQNYQTSDSVFHDDIVRRGISDSPNIHHGRSSPMVAGQSADIVRKGIPDPPRMHHGRSSPMVVGQSANFVRDANPYLSHNNYRALSRSKTCEADGSGRLNISDGGSMVPGHIYSDYRDCAISKNSDISFRSASAAENRGVQFSPADLGSAPLNDRYPIDFHPYGVSPGMHQEFLSCQMPEEILTSRRLQSPRGNVTDLDMRNQQYDAVNDELEWYNIHSSHMKNDNIGYNSSECACTDSTKQRKSVFTRLASTSRTPAQHDQGWDTDTDIESSVDELMGILHESEKSRLKKLNRKKPAVQHLGEGEKKINGTMGSLENFPRNSDLRFVPGKYEKSTRAVDGTEGEKKRNGSVSSLDNCLRNSDLGFVPDKIKQKSINAVEENAHETLTETRAVEFRRRGEKNRSMCDKTECKDLKENDKSGENAEHEVQMDKQPKRRKLVRPVFAGDDGGFNVNKSSAPPSETTDNVGIFVNSANASDGIHA